MEQKGVEYRRISTEDQSNWSISGQGKTNQEFAKSRGIHIVKTFTDDGFSAKSFDRPGWKSCIRYLKENKDIKFLIITKYDRLIRNASRGLAMIERLEDQYGIKILSVQENFFIDPFSPYFFKMRADILVNAEFERRVISDRTKFGIWSARSQGRFIGHAPYGYSNSRDEYNKPILVIDHEAAHVVRRIFDLFIHGDGFSEIAKKSKEIGLQHKSKMAIKRILDNPIYVGMIAVPGFKDTAATFAQGIHQPIIDKKTWKAAQRMIKGRKDQGNKIFRDEVPFRGLIYCAKCGYICTGGESKGKKKKYWYYRCSNCGKSYNANKVNTDILGIMRHLSISEDMHNLVMEESRKIIKEKYAVNAQKAKKLKSDIAELSAKRDAMELKFITDMIRKDTYDRHHSSLNTQIDLLQEELDEASKSLNTYLEELDRQLTSIKHLGDVFEIAQAKDKYLMLKGCCMYGLVVSENKYTTPDLNPIFRFISLINSKLQIDENLIREGKMVISNRSTRSVTIYQTLFDILLKLAS